MAIEVLLMADVPGLGLAGTVVKVAPGYARNFLLPKDLAAPVTAGALRQLDKRRKERDELARIQRTEAQAKADKLRKASVTIRAKTTDGQKLYGSVQAVDIVDKLIEQGVTVDHSQIDLAEPIKEIGTFDVRVKLHTDVEVAIKVWVVEE
jgi:large subunit ribosomal protein L9